MAADGKSLTFETDKFSTYALAYVDTLNISADDPNNGEVSSGIGDVGGNQNNGWNMGNIINPSTSDKIATSLAIFVISIIGLGGVITYMRTKRNLN